jgi:hypothetical protein
MPTAPTLVQSKSGTGLGTEGTTPVTATLDAAVTAGNTVIICATAPRMGQPGVALVLSSKPADFTVDLETSYGTTVAAAVCVLSRVMHQVETASWDLFPFGTDVRVNWTVLEYSGMPPYPAKVTHTHTATFLSTDSSVAVVGPTGTLGHSGTLALAFFTSNGATTWSGYTNGFAELYDAGATNAPSHAVASKYSSTPTAPSLEALQTVTTGNSFIGALLVYEVADATFAESLVFQDGFERGTPYGMSNTTNPTAGTRAASAVAGTPGTDILVGSAYSAGPWSTAGLRIVNSGLIKYVRWDSNILGVQRDLALGFHCRVVSSTGEIKVAEVNSNAGITPARLVYDTTTSKLGVRWSTSSPVWQAGTTAPGAWVWIDWQLGGFGGVSRSMRWSIDGVAQAAPADVATNYTSVASINIGAAGTQTATVDFDDLIVSGILAAYPYTKHHVRLLPVDPAGTPSISGTAANFNVFTANTTLAAWNAINARDAVDEVPPTISASADGVCQVTTAAADYAEFPVAPYVITGPEAVTGVRAWAAAWSGTGAGSGTMEIRGHDGTTETSLFPTGTAWLPGSVTTPSTTVPPWVTAQWVPAGGWTQAKLDAAALRFGFSNDATPDMGVHNLFLEAAVRANAIDEKYPVYSWRVDYTDGTSHASASGPPTRTTGVRGVTHWHDPAPYVTMDHGWPAYRVAGVTLFGETESAETFEAWRLAVLAEPHPLA